jgi:hypothetical protein
LINGPSKREERSDRRNLIHALVSEVLNHLDRRRSVAGDHGGDLKRWRQPRRL